MPARRRRLVVMLKEPRPGRAKTRLGAGIGMVPAAWWYRHQALGLLRRVRDPRWETWIAVAPDVEGLASRVWPEGLPRMAQGGGDLGARMARMLRALPPGPACLIGGDIPDLGRAHVARAFALLGAHDAVFGPAEDGGFWLVGLRRTGAVPAGIFRDVRWSTGDALSDSIASLGRARIALADTLRDVDDADDLVRVTAGRRRAICRA